MTTQATASLPITLMVMEESIPSQPSPIRSRRGSVQRMEQEAILHLPLPTLARPDGAKVGTNVDAAALELDAEEEAVMQFSEMLVQDLLKESITEIILQQDLNIISPTPPSQLPMGYGLWSSTSSLPTLPYDHLPSSRGSSRGSSPTSRLNVTQRIAAKEAMREAEARSRRYVLDIRPASRPTSRPITRRPSDESFSSNSRPRSALGAVVASLVASPPLRPSPPPPTSPRLTHMPIMSVAGHRPLSRPPNIASQGMGRSKSGTKRAKTPVDAHQPLPSTPPPPPLPMITAARGHSGPTWVARASNSEEGTSVSPGPSLGLGRVGKARKLENYPRKVSRTHHAPPRPVLVTHADEGVSRTEEASQHVRIDP